MNQKRYVKNLVAGWKEKTKIFPIRNVEKFFVIKIGYGVNIVAKTPKGIKFFAKEFRSEFIPVKNNDDEENNE